MKLAQDYTVRFKDYGSITVPKGTRVTHQTALGIDEKYHFVNEYEWIDKGYLKIANLLRMDVHNYGINVPKYLIQYFVDQQEKEKDELIDFLRSENSIEERTEAFHQWMKNQDDSIKMSYKLNWRISHSLFNISCKYFDGADIQNIDWFKIFKTQDIGEWRVNDNTQD